MRIQVETHLSIPFSLHVVRGGFWVIFAGFEGYGSFLRFARRTMEFLCGQWIVLTQGDIVSTQNCENLERFLCVIGILLFGSAQVHKRWKVEILTVDCFKPVFKIAF